jgi:hypothetical protein
MIVNTLNQPIRFREENTILDSDCDCNGRSYNQIITQTDQTQFQIQGDELLENGAFDDGLTGWDTVTSLSFTVVSLNESSLATCDGSIAITASGGTPAYSYSKDGITYQVGNTFNLLCAGNYTIFVKDSLGMVVSQIIGIGTSVNCLSYAGSEAFDVLALNAIDVKNCEAFNFI